MEKDEFEAEFVQKHLPVIVRDIPKDWNASREWKPLQMLHSQTVQQYLDLGLCSLLSYWRIDEDDNSSCAVYTVVVVDVASKDKESTYFSGDDNDRQHVEFKFGQILELYDAIYSDTPHWARKLLDDMKFYLCQCPIVSHDPSVEPKLPDLMSDLAM